MAGELFADVEARIRSEIADLKRRLNEAENMLEDLFSRRNKSGDDSMRFYGWKPYKAMIVVIREHGAMMTKENVVQAIVAGGLTVGKKRPDVNIRRSLETNLKNGNLVQKGDYIDIRRNVEEGLSRKSPK